MAGFAVVDCETTGLGAPSDRIVEIAVVLLDDAGRPEGSWSSLVNPDRPVGATSTHGIGVEDIARAPGFADISDTVAGLLESRVFVAHNVGFDASFVEAEFARAGSPFAIPEGVRVCTMELSKIYLPVGRHSLAAVASRAGIEASATHRALADAQTAASLLQIYLAREAEGIRFADAAQTRSGGTVRAASWLGCLERAGSVPIRGNREEPASARDGAAWTSSSTRSGGFVRA